MTSRLAVWRCVWRCVASGIPIPGQSLMSVSALLQLLLYEINRANVICKNVGILLTSWRKLQLTVASTLIHMHRMLPNWQYITNVLQGWRQSCCAELDRNQCICLSGPHLVASQPWPLNQNVINSHLTPSAPKLQIWLNSLKQLTSFCVHKLLGSTDKSMDKRHGTKACNVSCMWHTGEGKKPHGHCGTLPTNPFFTARAMLAQY